MPFYKISQLPEKDSADKDDIIEVSVKTGENTYESKSVSVEQIADATITQFEYESLTTTQKTIVGAINDIDSGHTSVEVTPIKLDGTNIADITVNGNVNDIFGNNVVANPDEQSTEILLTLKVEDKVYSTTKKFVYGFHIDSSESDPTACVSYLKDAIGMTPAYMDYVTGQFNYGSWKDIWFIKYCKPCVVDKTGTVTTYLNPNDYSKDLEGNTVVINSSLPSGSNVMIEFPKIWIKIVPDEGSTTSASIYVSEFQVDEDFHDYPYKNTDDTSNEKLYLQAYNASGTTALLRSVSNAQYCKNSTFEEEYAGWLANGQYCHMTTLSETMLVNILLILISKSLDTQIKFGQGLTSDGSTSLSDNFRTGIHNQKGLFYGTSSTSLSTYTNAVKVFGIENWWGFNERRICGYIFDGTSTKYKLCFGKADGTTVDYYNATGEGYLSIPSIPTGTSGNYITSYSFINNVMLPNASSASGSSSTYYCDSLTDYSTGIRVGFIGGNSQKQSQCGAFYNNLQLADYPSYQNSETANPLLIQYALQADTHSLVVNIEPVQDLHGYDSPWPAGGGKNKTDYSTPFVGTAREQKNYTLFTMVLPAGEYTYSCKQSVTIPSNIRNTLGVKVGGNNIIYEHTTGVNYNPPDLRHKMTFTVSEESTCVFSYWSHTPSVSATLTEWQVEVGSSFTGYAPYSNICPITGWTGCEVSHSGANTSDPTVIPISWQTEAGTVYGGVVDIVKGELVVDSVYIKPSMLALGNYTQQENGGERTLALTINAKDVSYSAESVPYTESIGFVQRGYYYYTSGRLDTVTTPKNAFAISSGRNSMRIYVLGANSVEDFDAGIADLEIVYAIQDPVIYNLTPVQVQTLLGTNIIYADAGKVSIRYKMNPDQRI